MNATHTEFLTWKMLPARLNATQTAWFLGFECHEITILAATGLLKPLCHPARNATKFFATATLEQLRRDEKWLMRATNTLATCCKENSARKQSAWGRGGARRVGVFRRSAPAVEEVAAPLAAPAAAEME